MLQSNGEKNLSALIKKYGFSGLFQKQSWELVLENRSRYEIKL